MLTCDESTSHGPIVTAVCSHSPGQAVLAEADALDRELLVSPRLWKTLLRGIEAFVDHYPSLLLNSPNALKTLGNACREGVQTATENQVRTQAATLLLSMQNAISAVIIREGVARVDPEIPALMCSWLSDLSASDEFALVEPEQLLSPLLNFGKSILMVADDGKPPQQWFALLFATDRLLLTLLQRQITYRPTNGSSDEVPSGGMPTRVDNRQKDVREWLRTLETALINNERTAADVFLELSVIAKRRGLHRVPPTGGNEVDAD